MTNVIIISSKFKLSANEYEQISVNMSENERERVLF